MLLLVDYVTCLSVSISLVVPPVSEWSTLEKHQRSFYQTTSQLGGTTDWPPALPVEYINLELVHQDRFPVSSMHRQEAAKLLRGGEVGAVLKQSTQLDLKDISNYDSHRKVILIEGAPGVGKTTLAHKLCRDWANKELLTEFSLVLYVPLRVPKVRVADSADDLLQYFGEHCSPSDTAAITYSQGNGVLFILDGWDELPQSCRLASSFFPRLVFGEFLPKSSVIITSRPGVVVTAIRTQAANRLIEILGFTEEQVKQYIRSYFRESPDFKETPKRAQEISQNLITELQVYPNVASTCYVAINLTIICFVYHASGFKLPSTLTEVYEQFVMHAIKRHINRAISVDPSKAVSVMTDNVETVSGFDESVNTVLRGLGKLALEGIVQGALSFTRGELASACCLNESEEFDGFGLLRILLVFRRHGPERNYQFLHLTVQEYLAAYTVSLMEENQQGKWLQDNLRNDV